MLEETEPPRFVSLSRIKAKNAAAVKVMVCLAVLATTCGCACFRGGESDQSWSQTAAREDQEQHISAPRKAGLMP